mmetsp:Transcript_25607/g.55470  ORF Transcript_25607/g.55470 Transcript_25607/m.55470 type:complete len:227 (-) Transcript_25607:98-778(-)
MRASRPSYRRDVSSGRRVWRCHAPLARALVERRVVCLLFRGVCPATRRHHALSPQRTRVHVPPTQTQTPQTTSVWPTTRARLNEQPSTQLSPLSPPQLAARSRPGAMGCPEPGGATRCGALRVACPPPRRTTTHTAVGPRDGVSTTNAAPCAHWTAAIPQHRPHTASFASCARPHPGRTPPTLPPARTQAVWPSPAILRTLSRLLAVRWRPGEEALRRRGVGGVCG